MNYLKRVLNTLKEVNWEIIDPALAHSMRSILVIAVTALIYWMIDNTIMGIF